MKTTLIIQQENKFQFDYLKNINTRVDNSNLFMEGQKECANHATIIIANFMAKTALLEIELSELKKTK